MILAMATVLVALQRTQRANGAYAAARSRLTDVSLTAYLR